MKYLLIVCQLLCTISAVTASTYYLSPNNGATTNDGSVQQPWPDLQTVLDAGMVSTNEYVGLPYDSLTSTLTPKNIDGIIQPGDTLMLLSGYYGHVEIDRHYNSDYIVVIAAAGAVPEFASIHIRSCQYWRLQGLHIDASLDYDLAANRLLYIESHGFRGPSADIIVDGCSLTSGADGWEWSADQWLSRSRSGIYSSAIRSRMTANTLTNIDHGITLIGNYSQAIGNSISNFSGDGLRMLGSHQRMEANLVKNCFKVDDNHDDAFQSFSIDGHNPSYDTLRGNTIINHEDYTHPLAGPLQGVGCFDGPYHNWLVENNLISVNHWHGITFLGAYDCRIMHNTVIDPLPSEEPGSSWIRVADDKQGNPSEGCIVANNIADRFVVDGQSYSNMTLTTVTDYDLHFTDWSANDFSLLPSSSLIDSGVNLGTPVDIIGTSRPQGMAHDTGAYEYVAAASTNETALPTELLIYPNPSPSDFVIVHNGKSLLLALYTIDGRQVSHTSIRTAYGYRISIDNEKPATYILTYQAEDGQQTAHQLVMVK